MTLTAQLQLFPPAGAIIPVSVSETDNIPQLSRADGGWPAVKRLTKPLRA